MKLKNRLKELRARDGLNQTELARRAEVSRQTISLLERGEYTPSIIIALKIAHIFGETVENVFRIEEELNNLEIIVNFCFYLCLLFMSYLMF